MTSPFMTAPTAAPRRWEMWAVFDREGVVGVNSPKHFAESRRSDLPEDYQQECEVRPVTVIEGHGLATRLSPEATG